VRFTHKRVVSYIMSGAEYVATLRNYKYVPGSVVSLKLCPPDYKRAKRARALVVRVIDNWTDEHLQRFLPISGFGDAREWKSEALRLHRGRKPKYLVVLKVLRNKNY